MYILRWAWQIFHTVTLHFSRYFTLISDNTRNIMYGTCNTLTEAPGIAAFHTMSEWTMCPPFCPWKKHIPEWWPCLARSLHRLEWSSWALLHQCWVIWSWGHRPGCTQSSAPYCPDMPGWRRAWASRSRWGRVSLRRTLWAPLVWLDSHPLHRRCPRGRDWAHSTQSSQTESDPSFSAHPAGKALCPGRGRAGPLPQSPTTQTPPSTSLRHRNIICIIK